MSVLLKMTAIQVQNALILLEVTSVHAEQALPETEKYVFVRKDLQLIKAVSVLILTNVKHRKKSHFHNIVLSI